MFNYADSFAKYKIAGTLFAKYKITGTLFAKYKIAGTFFAKYQIAGTLLPSSCLFARLRFFWHHC
jgi:hypothetical protein